MRLVLLWSSCALYVVIASTGWRRELGFDSHAYWLVSHHHGIYGNRPNTREAFLYSPAFAQLIWPLAQLPWPLFLALWTAVGFLLYVWLLWPLGWRRMTPFLLLCVPQAAIGNIWPLLAVVLIFGTERAPLWAIALLTKVTAGVGVVWFAARREWRQLAAVGCSVLVVVAVSAAISPQLWISWLRLLVDGGSGGVPAGAYDVPLVYRLPIAVVVAVYAARRGRRDVLAIATVIACPVFALGFYFASLPILLALPRLRKSRPGLEPSLQARRVVFR